jgi:hypothetical protein
MNLVKCPECHSENRLGEETCSNCGAPLVAEESRSANTDWLSDLSEMIASVQSEEEAAMTPEGLPDWLQDEHPEQVNTSVDEGDELLDWLRDIRPVGAVTADEVQADDDLPMWLKRATGPLQEDTTALPDEGVEDTHNSAAVSAQTESDTSTTPDEPDEPLPGWVSELTSSEEWPETVNDTAVADWFAHHEEDKEETERLSPQMPMTRPLNPTKELRGVPRQLATESLPEWLSDQIEETPGDSVTSADLLNQGSDVLDAANAEHTDRLRSDEEDEQEDEIPGQVRSLEGLGELPSSPNDDWLSLLDDTPVPAEDGIELELDDRAIPDAMQAQNAELPEWLLALKPGTSRESTGSVSPLPVESSGPLAGLRGVIPVAPVIAGNARERRAVSFEQSKEQQQQIALLQELRTAAPDLDDSVGEQSSGAMFAVARILLGSALLIFAILGWLLPSLGVDLPLPVPAEVPAAARETYDTLNNASGQMALVAFEYTPALAGELDAVAGTLLRHLADNDSPIITVSQSAAGSAVAERAVANVEGLESYPLGFIPGEAIGLRQLADCLEDSDTCQRLSTRPVDGAAQAALEDVSLIVVLASERDGLSNWVEQVGSQSDSSMVAGVAQQLGPVAAPYRASEQLSGYVNGVPAAAAYEQRLRGNEEYAVEWLTSLTLVHWLVIAVLAAGSLYFGVLGLASARDRRAGI